MRGLRTGGASLMQTTSCRMGLRVADLGLRFTCLTLTLLERQGSLRAQLRAHATDSGVSPPPLAFMVPTLRNMSSRELVNSNTRVA